MRIPLVFKIQGSIKTGSPADLKLQITIHILVCNFKRSTIYHKKFGNHLEYLQAGISSKNNDFPQKQHLTLLKYRAKTAKYLYKVVLVFS
jgi:hypothetical protein